MAFIFCLSSNISFSQDTINRKDASGNRYGYWVIFASLKSTPGYHADQIIEEGYYSKNKKSGVWTSYHTNGKIKSKISYVNGRPLGEFILYTEKGCIQEKGNWQYSRFVGEYFGRFGYPEIIQHFFFNPAGKRVGKQYYYYPDGKLQLFVIMDERGNEIYTAHYDKEGKKIKTTPDSLKIIHPDSSKLKIDVEKIFGCKPDTVISRKTGTIPIQPPYGFVGEMKNGVPWEGKWYKYDKNGLLLRIEIIKEGKYVGDVPIENDDKKIKSDCDRCKNTYTKLYNAKKLLVEDGEFRCCKLYSGKKYYYDESDKPVKIEIYKEGKYVEDAELD
ncbi:MAG: toxin-antitoxin system YwqK family antitoxin [Bacteroidota bacterium]